GGSPGGVFHACQPMGAAFRHLVRNLELNGLTNVAAQQLGLWDQAGATLSLQGPPALASSTPAEQAPGEERIPAVTLDDYVASRRLEKVGLIMLDIEGSEERALLGARRLLARPWPDAPHLVFEIHGNYVD